MEFSKALMSVSQNTMLICSNVLQRAFADGTPKNDGATHSYKLRDGMVMRVRFSVEIVKPEDH